MSNKGSNEIIFSRKFFKAIMQTLDSYKVRALIDAKEDIIEVGIYSEAQYFNILFELIDEEKLKYELYEYLKEQGEADISQLEMFAKHKDIRLNKTLSLCYLLEREGLINIEEIYEKSKNSEEETLQIFKNFNFSVNNVDITSIKPIYEPVQIIFDSNICSGCGLCAGICPMNCITINNGFGEIDDDKCIRCGLCYYVCPRTYLPVKLLNIYQDDASEVKNYSKIGVYKEAYSARTKIDEIKEVCQDGGVSSTCLYYLLENNKIDLAIGAKMGEKLWCPEPTLIKDKKDIIETAGTKYVNNPNLKLLNEIDPEKKVAIVGVPCMMQALLKSKIYDINIPLLNNIQYRIGIFCMESFPYEEGFLKICERLNVEVNDVKKTDINKGKFFVYTKNGEELNVPIKEVTNLAREDCEVCYDLTSESADISIGSIGAPSGWNVVLVRNERGKELYDALIENGLIESKPIEEVKPGLPLLLKIANSKKNKSSKHILKKIENEKRYPYY
ncbi:MAG: Coenzyme F420 hydrogenase/dehydrogenase, beta subunit C-terminal domain [Promethearchaeati archaeon]